MSRIEQERERKEKVLGTTAVIKLLTNRRQGLLVSINTPPTQKKHIHTFMTHHSNLHHNFLLRVFTMGTNPPHSPPPIQIMKVKEK